MTSAKNLTSFKGGSVKGRTEVNYYKDNIKSTYFFIPLVFGVIGIIIQSYIEILGTLIIIGALLYGIIFYIKIYLKEENMKYYKIETNTVQVSQEEFEATK